MLVSFITATVIALLISMLGIPFGLSFIVIQVMALPVYFIESLVGTSSRNRKPPVTNITNNDYSKFVDARSVHMNNEQRQGFPVIKNHEEG